MSANINWYVCERAISASVQLDSNLMSWFRGSKHVSDNWALDLIVSFQVSPNGAVLSYSDPTLVFVFLLVFTVATINFSFMISAFFSRGVCFCVRPRFPHVFVLCTVCVVKCLFHSFRSSRLKCSVRATVRGPSDVGQSAGFQLFSDPKHKSSNKRLLSYTKKHSYTKL